MGSAHAIRRASAMLAGIAMAVSVLVATPMTSAAAPSPTARSTTDPAWPVDTRGDGCTTPVWPSAPKQENYRRVLFLGDSLFRNSRSILEPAARAQDWLPTTRCWGAKGTDWGLQQVIRARQLRQLPRTVVVSLGTNDIWWLGIDLATGIDSMMREIGSRKKVYWVNLWFGPHGYDRLPPPTAANRILRAKAKQYPNLTIVNFAKAFRTAAKAGIPVGWEDGVHLNAAGNRVRVEAIMDALGEPQRRR